MENQLNPSKIMQIGTGFWASKTLLAAINFGLFTLLARGELSGREIQNRLELHERGLYDFLDALVALGFLRRKGLKESAFYANTDETDLFLDKQKPGYVGGILEMANNRLYPCCGDLEDGLRTGLPQNEIKVSGEPVFSILYADSDKLREFIGAMAGVQMGNFIMFSQIFDFSKYKTHCDLGGAGGHLAAQIAINNPHMHCISWDLPPVEAIAAENIKNMQVTESVSLQSGDFFVDEIPNAEVITMGNILHDWGLAEKQQLISKAYDALPPGGALVVIENLIDDARQENAFGLLMSLNMLIETPAGFDFTESEFKDWAQAAGFQKVYSMPLTGPSSAAIAIK